MAEDNPLDKLRVAKETEYFHNQQQALLRELRRRDELKVKRTELAAATNISDENVLQELVELGFDRDTVGLLHIVPLVEIAWADGKVSEHEKSLILELARVRGAGGGTAGFQHLTGWLTKRPTDAFFSTTLDAIARVLATLPQEQHAAIAGDLIAQSKRVAEASGGFLGLGHKISPEEEALLHKIVAELKA